MLGTVADAIVFALVLRVLLGPPPRRAPAPAARLPHLTLAAWLGCLGHLLLDLISGGTIRLFAPFSDNIEWISLQSAEMTKHALNSFLALSVAYTNELARICERVGADASEVERGLRSEPRIGRRAYVAAGPPIAGGTLLIVIGVLMVSGIWSIWMYELQAVITGFVPAI